MLKLIKKKKPVVPEVVTPVPVPAAPVAAPIPEAVLGDQIPEVPTAQPVPVEAPAGAPVKNLEPWSVVRIPIQERDAIYNSNTGEYLTIEQVLVKLMNWIDSDEE